MIMMTTTSKKTINVGIDYSMAAPAICVHIGSEWAIENCSFYYLTNRKKFENPPQNGVYKALEASLTRSFDNPIQRYIHVKDWALNTFKMHPVEDTKVWLEDYSYASTGRVFGIGENTGVLKHALLTEGYEYETIPPTVVKKLSTDKGNANKELMEDTFVNEVGFSFKDLLEQTDKQWNPSSDLVDAYYIAKVGFYDVDIIKKEVNATS